VNNHRELFPVTKRCAYLNNAGVAPPPTVVRAAMAARMVDMETHGLTNDDHWEQLADGVRADAARLIGAEMDEVAFVRNTSHGLGLIAEGIDWRPGDEVCVAASIEYPSNVYPWQRLADRGVSVKEIRPTEGGVTPEALKDVISSQTRLVSVSAVQYASGHKADLKSLGQLCQDHDALFCVDGIQQVGAFELDVKACGIHFLAADSHKWMLGVTGIGFMYVDNSVAESIRPALVGWKSSTHAFDFDNARLELPPNARRFEEGSPAYPMIAGMGASLALIHEVGIPAISKHIESLNAYAEAGALELGASVGPAPVDRAGILMVTPRGDAAAVVAACEQNNVSVSLRRGRVRIAPHLYNNQADIDAFLAVLKSAG